MTRNNEKSNLDDQSGYNLAYQTQLTNHHTSLKQKKTFEDTLNNSSSPRTSPRNSKDVNPKGVNSGFEIYVTSIKNKASNLMFQDQHGMTIETIGASKEKTTESIEPNAAGVDRNLKNNNGFNQQTYKQFPIKIRYTDRSPKKIKN